MVELARLNPPVLTAYLEARAEGRMQERRSIVVAPS